MEKPEGLRNEEEIREKVKIIEKMPTGVTNIAGVILILLGEKPALELFLPDKEDAERVISNLHEIGLFAEISSKPEKEDQETADILVARSQEVIDELKHTSSFNDHKRYGELMGYPSTAIDAFNSENGQERASWEEMDQLTKDLPIDLAGEHFVLSKQYAHQEVKVIKKWIKLIAQYAPELFYDQYGNEEGGRLLKEALEY